jgi:TRAP-type C4-dicarboxylate transport system permease large subunit
VGFNLFVISALNEDDVFVIARHAMPFFVLMALTTALITVFPWIVMVMPNLMR